jgi:hypothetical protein
VSLFSAVADLLKPAPPPDARLQAALDRVISMISPTLRYLPNLERQLAPAVDHALGYCEGLVAALPGPITINRRAFGTDPLVHALFATAGDIDEMLGRSQAIRDTIDHRESWQGEYFHAMLAARRQQKKQFGMAQHGDIIRNDVPQEVLYFSDQTLVGPSCDLETTRQKLREKALESLLHSFNAHVDALRLERDALRADASAEQSQLAMDSAADLPINKAHTRHLAELDARLRSNVEALAPEHLIATLIDFLRAPEMALSLEAVTVNVDRLGIVHAGANADDQVDTLRFPELISRDRRQHIAMLVTIPCQDALAAVEKARDQQHRYIII